MGANKMGNANINRQNGTNLGPSNNILNGGGDFNLMNSMEKKNTNTGANNKAASTNALFDLF